MENAETTRANIRAPAVYLRHRSDDVLAIRRHLRLDLPGNRYCISGDLAVPDVRLNRNVDQRKDLLENLLRQLPSSAVSNKARVLMMTRWAKTGTTSRLISSGSHVIATSEHRQRLARTIQSLRPARTHSQLERFEVSSLLNDREHVVDRASSTRTR